MNKTSKKKELKREIKNLKENSLFLISKKIVKEQYNIIKELVDNILYSFKTNPEIGLILLKETNSDFSIHNINDIILIKDFLKKNNLNKKEKEINEKIWFFLQANEKKELDFLIKNNINKFVVDNINDLNNILEFIKDNDYAKNKGIELMLRIRMKEYTINTGKHFVFGFFSEKAKEIIYDLKKKYMNKKDKNNYFIKKIGIHFHRKTQNVAEWFLKEELEEIFTKEFFKEIDYLDIGGGIPVNYKNYNINQEFILKKIKELKSFLKKIKKEIKIMAEPGRFIAAPSTILLTKIKNIYDNNIIVDASIYNSAMGVFDSNIRYEIVGEDEVAGVPYVIKGSTPDSIDIFRYKAYLKEPKIGDYIIFKNVGAYNYHTSFCNLKELPVIIIEDFKDIINEKEYKKSNKPK